MTLETAKEIVKDVSKLPNKEAEAVVRGGMNICDHLPSARIYSYLFYEQYSPPSFVQQPGARSWSSRVAIDQITM